MTVSLERVTTKMDKYVQRTKDMSEVLNAPMDWHHLSYMHMCEDLFSQ